ncbi:MAG: hypothetical protein H6905_11070 [Hyphomicrobiales bacterium]|nr:hypothetical protein [Hyphomicrobiales bacterium]
MAQSVDRGQSTPPAATSVSVLAVKPAAKSEASSRAVDDEDREKEAASEQHMASATPSAGESYDRRVVYEREFNRTFIDVVERDDKDERLMRIPSEKLVKFIEDMNDPSSPSETATGPRLDAIV